MGVISKLFGSEKVIDGVMRGADALAYTPEEKAEMHSRLLKLYEPFKLAQRLLALTFCVPYAAAWLITFGASFSADMNVSLQLDLLNGDIGNIVLMIVIFYFGGGTIESLVKVRK